MARCVHQRRGPSRTPARLACSDVLEALGDSFWVGGLGHHAHRRAVPRTSAQIDGEDPFQPRHPDEAKPRRSVIRNARQRMQSWIRIAKTRRRVKMEKDE